MGFIDFYNYLVDDCSDPRTKDWFLLQSPVLLAAILGSYYYFIRFCGPKFMENREPYSLKTYIKFYNVFQIITNAIISYLILTSGWLTTYTLGCVEMDPSPTGEGLRMAGAVWWLAMLKLVDLTETMVYVLRKKTKQISFLHVYHHISTAVIAWMGAKWLPGGMLSMVIMVNCAVHVIMYSFYLLTTGGPTCQKIASWIKPWITIIQMTQFTFLLGHSAQGWMPPCITHSSLRMKIASAVLVSNLWVNFVLFYNFYQENYVKKANQKSPKLTQ